MDITKYVDLMKNTIKYELPGHNLQDIINRLTKNKVACYKDVGDNIVKISSEDSKQDRIIKCLEMSPIDTITNIEWMYIEKGYRYSIYYKCDDFVINNELSNYNDLNNYSPMCIEKGVITDFSKPILLDNGDKVIIKFLKEINPYYTKIDKTKYVLYNTLWIYHKKLKILEHRFDSLSFKGNDNFYNLTKDAQMSTLRRDFKFKLKEFRTSNLIDKIISQNKNEVQLKGQDLGLKGNSSAKLKVGADNVMPFIGDLEQLIEKNRDVLYENKESEKIAKIFTDYICEIKKEAKYKSRLIEISADGGVNLNVRMNVFFSYRDNTYDLYSFLESNKIDMEMMNNAIEYIFKFYTDNKGDK